MDEGEEILTTYLFDDKEFLQKVIMLEFGRESIIYDREKELASAMRELAGVVSNDMFSTIQSA
ncbi:hypothetical protein ACFU8X_08830 [Brevibacillus porteri]|uniref:hypothetical protein n=1 Tax=Brevibacillus porteri TaxID=2126350 RepID=UPI00370C5DB9